MDVSAELRRLAPILNGLPYDAHAELDYSIWCDGLYWSDELPIRGLGDDTMMRYLLQYRTWMIRGRGESPFEATWNEAKTLFPNWPGFAEERCRRDIELEKKHEVMSAQAMKQMLDAMDEN